MERHRQTGNAGTRSKEDTLSIPGEALGVGHSRPPITSGNQYLIKVSTEPSPARPSWSNEGEEGKERVMRKGDDGGEGEEGEEER